MSIFSDQDKFLIRAFYQLTNTQQLIDKLLGGRFNVRQVIDFANHYGIKKHSDYYHEPVNGFKHGNIPKNKGVYKSNNLRAIRERNRKIVLSGLSRTQSERNGIPHKRMKSHIVWEQHNGEPVPTGHIITFRDGDYTNCSIDNLELITKAEMMRRNSINRYPQELQDVIRIKGLITRKIKHAEKHNIRT